jgi:zinc protease
MLVLLERKKAELAHLFEHLPFLESENLGKGGLDKMSARGGAGANASTATVPIITKQFLKML